MKKSLLFLLLFLFINSYSADTVDIPYSYVPPNDFTPEETPMFVCIGWDDNAYEDAMTWSDSMLTPRKNHDGSPVRSTYFICPGFAREHFRDVGGQTKETLQASWQNVTNRGHEIACHTYQHPNAGSKQGGDGSQGQNFSKQQWIDEITKANDSLSSMLNIPISSIKGFRVPYLSFNVNTYPALAEIPNFIYDCSIEWGYGAGFSHPDLGWLSSNTETGNANLFFPYTLDEGTIPGTINNNPIVSGLWQIQVYTYLNPTSTGNLNLPGFDGNMWTSKQNKDEFFETWKYNLDIRRNGNRAPLSINCHTDNYSEFNEAAEVTYTEATWQERREAFEMFVDYALTLPEVRIVPMEVVIEWMKNPIKESVYIAPTKEGDTPISFKNIAQRNSNISPLISFDNSIIKLNIEETANYTISMYDLKGKLIHQISRYFNQGISNLELSKNLSKGMYMIQIDSVKRSFAHKLKIDK